MKRFGFFMAAAALSMGISGTAAFSSQAGLSTIMIGGNSNSFNTNCSSNNNNCFSSQPSAANSCTNPQNILSYLTSYRPTPYINNTYCSNNNFSNNNCSNNNSLNNNCLNNNSSNNNCSNNNSSNNNCSNNNSFNDEEYFPGQRPGENCPTQNQPIKDKPAQTNPDTNKPSQTDPDKNKPSQTVPDTNKPNQTDPDKDKPSQNIPEDNTNQSYVQQVIALVNEERAKAGLSPLTESSAVSSAAYTRSKEITQNFSHNRPDGTSFSTVLRQNGISFTSCGENIAYGQKTPAEVMNTWMNSSGHRANILNSNYTTIGVGCYQAANGTLYWTQLFTR